MAGGGERISNSRTKGTELVLTNKGNASVELAEGKLCGAYGKNCLMLLAKRFYADASWRQALPREAGGEYRMR